LHSIFTGFLGDPPSDFLIPFWLKVMPRKIIVGYDYRFGRNGKGCQEPPEMGKEFNIAVEVMEL